MNLFDKHLILKSLEKMLEKLKELIRSRDLFGKPVQLTYKGKSAFNTVCGGCVSLLLILVILVGACYQLVNLIGEPTFSSLPATYESLYASGASYSYE